MFPGLSASLGNLEMPVLGPHTRPTKSDTLDIRPSNLHFNKLPDDFQCENHCCMLLGFKEYLETHYYFKEK